MYNKSLDALYTDAHQDNKELRAFNRNFSARHANHGQDEATIEFYLRCNTTANMNGLVYHSMSRDDYNEIIQKPYNRCSNGNARGFLLYHHLQDTGQLDTWRKHARETRII
jgi:hypothetical protein